MSMEASRRSDVPDHLLDKLQENLSHAGMAEDTLDESNCVVNDRVNQTLDQDVLKSVEQAVNALDFLKNNSSPTGREESHSMDQGQHTDEWSNKSRDAPSDPPDPEEDDIFINGRMRPYDTVTHGDQELSLLENLEA